MGFFTDMLSGGGDLYNSVTPKELRRMIPREIQPGGFNPGRDWLGVDLDGSLAAEAMRKAQAQTMAQQQGAQQAFDQSANAPIPGLTGPTTGLLGGPSPQAGVVTAGLMNPHQTQLQEPLPQQPAPFQPQGPYGQQAAQMAGLLSGRGFVPPPPQGQPQDPNMPPKRLPFPFGRGVR